MTLWIHTLCQETFLFFLLKKECISLTFYFVLSHVNCSGQWMLTDTVKAQAYNVCGGTFGSSSTFLCHKKHDSVHLRSQTKHKSLKINDFLWLLRCFVMYHYYGNSQLVYNQTTLSHCTSKPSKYMIYSKPIFLLASCLKYSLFTICIFKLFYIFRT